MITTMVNHSFSFLFHKKWRKEDAIIMLWMPVNHPKFFSSLAMLAWHVTIHALHQFLCVASIHPCHAISKIKSCSNSHGPGSTRPHLKLLHPNDFSTYGTA